MLSQHVDESHESNIEMGIYSVADAKNELIQIILSSELGTHSAIRRAMHSNSSLSQPAQSLNQCPHKNMPLNLARSKIHWTKLKIDYANRHDKRHDYKIKHTFGYIMSLNIDRKYLSIFFVCS